MASSLLPQGVVRRIGAILRALMLDGAKEVPPAAEIGGGAAEHRLDRSQPWISGVTRGRLRRIVTRALALTPRGFIPHDVPRLNKLSAQLRVEWLTRDIHPWDRVLPLRRRAELFRDQASRDTDAAISRLFQILPDLDAIEIRVLEPHSPNRLVFAGTVVREDVLAARPVASPGMRLKLMGIRSHTTDGHLEPPDSRRDRLGDHRLSARARGLSTHQARPSCALLPAVFHRDALNVNLTPRSARPRVR